MSFPMRSKKLAVWFQACYWSLALTMSWDGVSAVRILPNIQKAAVEEVVASVLDQHQQNHHQAAHIGTEHRRLSSKVDVPFPSSPDDHEVTSLPLLSKDVLTTKHWAGLLPASPKGDKYLFYWLFAPDLSQNSELQDSDIPLVIWLNGGPGCSSMDGLFLENGPLRFEQKDSNGNFHLVAAEYSWHKTPAYTLYVDQPVGTGLSFTTSKKYPRNDREVNEDFYHFLQSFFEAHSDKFVANKRVSRGFYFSGESHAGHYIPSMMAYILDQNAKLKEDKTKDGIYIPLSGAAIGNGWVDPFHQYSAAEAAYGHGIIGKAQVAALREKEKECQDLLNQQRYSSSVCFNLLDDIVGQSYGSTSGFKVSQYDVRKVESQRGSRIFPPGHKTVETYLGGTGSAAGISADTMKSALEAIHATQSREAGQVYQECTNPPYDALSHQDGLGVVNEVVQVLEHDAEGEDPVRLLFFNGVTDLICNHVGNEIMLEELPWKHKEDWIKAARAAWKSKSQPGDNISGYIKEFKNLLFLKVMESGHMVPMDVPDVALDMMRLFLFGGEGAFQYSPQHLARAVPKNEDCPVCPVCPANITNYDRDSRANAASSASDGGSPDTQLWIGLAAMGCASLVGLYVWHQRARYGKRTNVATYDLEMRGGTYFDNPPVSTNGDAPSNGPAPELYRER